MGLGCSLYILVESCVLVRGGDDAGLGEMVVG